MVRPRRGKTVRIAPPRDESVRSFTDAVITLVTPEWVEVEHESWRFAAGTLLLLRRTALLATDDDLVAPDSAIVRVYPPRVQTDDYAARAIERLLRPPIVEPGGDSD
jgi:hypothetical protein